MVKIKIVQREQEIEGKIFEGKVTSFGTSAHIPFSKRFLGRKVKIIIPEEAECFWVFSEEERKEFVNAANNANKLKPESMYNTYPLRKEGIDAIKEDRFEDGQIARAANMILEYSKNKKEVDLAKKVEKAYGF